MARLAGVSLLSFCSSSPRQQETGLLGWVVLQVDRLFVVDGIVLRRTRDGRLALSFPAPRDRRGRPQALVRPFDDEARRAIEEAVLGALEGLQGAR